MTTDLKRMLDAAIAGSNGEPNLKRLLDQAILTVTIDEPDGTGATAHVVSIDHPHAHASGNQIHTHAHSHQPGDTSHDAHHEVANRTPDIKRLLDDAIAGTQEPFDPYRRMHEIWGVPFNVFSGVRVTDRASWHDWYDGFRARATHGVRNYFLGGTHDVRNG